MRRLQQRFPNELQILGVHTAKFPHERKTENVRQAAQRLGITHPIVNDTGSETDGSSLWQEYCVRGWPTVALIDPRGYMIAKHAGEIQAEAAIRLLETLIAETPVEPHTTESPSVANAPDLESLHFPSKVLADEDRLWIADSGHHRVLETDPPDPAGRARVRRVYGTGLPGWQDGTGADAHFHHPRGLTRKGRTLYVADTDNHLIRAIDLERGRLEPNRVRTVLGNGDMGRTIIKPPGLPRETTPLEIPLRSPWDVHAVGDLLLIAMAGAHQIWALQDEASAIVLAGSGREALLSGPGHLAAFNQPSGLAVSDDVLYVADAEASAVRAVTLGDRPQVRTLIGVGLFAFGDTDGEGHDVRLQHASDVAWRDGQVLIADTYNHKIKTLDPRSRHVQTLIGTGRRGSTDGPFETATFFEPEGLDVDRAGRLLIADTNNHRVRIADFERRDVRSLVLDFSQVL